MAGGAADVGSVRVTITPLPAVVIAGQVFEDRNGNGRRDAGEFGFDGWTIELLDRATGTLVDSVVSHSDDLDGDGTVDPITEQGLYFFDELEHGSYVVRQVGQVGFRQTHPDPVAQGGQHTVDLAPGATAEGLDFGNQDLAPRVLEVLISGRDWTAEFLAHLETHQLGTAGYSIPLGSASRLSPLPWSNVDEISLRFSESVDAQIDDLTVGGTDSGALPIELFDYDASTLTATWTLANPLTTDRFLLRLDDRATDEFGNSIDGEWTDRVSLQSGDGEPGGDFAFTFNIVVGNIDQDSTTTIFDIAAMRRALAGLADPIQFAFADLNANGQIDIADLRPLRSNLGRTSAQELEPLSSRTRHPRAPLAP